MIGSVRVITNVDEQINQFEWVPLQLSINYKVCQDNKKKYEVDKNSVQRTLLKWLFLNRHGSQQNVPRLSNSNTWWHKQPQTTQKAASKKHDQCKEQHRLRTSKLLGVKGHVALLCIAMSRQHSALQLKMFKMESPATSDNARLRQVSMNRLWHKTQQDKPTRQSQYSRVYSVVWPIAIHLGSDYYY